MTQEIAQKNIFIEASEVEPLDWYPPGEDDLPYDDGAPMESTRHRAQMNLLIETLQLFFPERSMFVGGNMGVYYRSEQEGTGISIAPDVFVAFDVSRRERKSWVIWREGKAPDVVVELLSPSTAAADKGSKKEFYQNSLRVPEYYYFDPFGGERAGFSLANGQYQPIPPDAQGRLISAQLGLALADWHGKFADIEGRWIRWYTLDGALVPTGAEQAQRLAEQERERAEQERERAEQERQRAAELEALLARYKAQFGDLGEGE